MTRRAWLAAFTAIVRTPQTDELIVDAVAGAILQQSNWQRPGRPQPCGSLVKVFTALAYRGPGFPTFHCSGAHSGCWSIPGHGSIGITAAIAHSCNAYFRSLAASVTPEQLALVAAAFRIEPPRDQSVDTRIGLGDGWLIAPEKVATAYLELVRRRHEPQAAAIVEGLRQCALTGTAKACGPGVLAKTGTSVCAHPKPQPGDGWAIGMFPDDRPRYAILIRQDGAPGAKAAEWLASRIRQMRGYARGDGNH